MEGGRSLVIHTTLRDREVNSRLKRKRTATQERVNQAYPNGATLGECLSVTCLPSCYSLRDK